MDISVHDLFKFDKVAYFYCVLQITGVIFKPFFKNNL